MTANYLRTTKWSSLVTTTLDHPMGRSSIWEIPTRCSGTMSETQEGFHVFDTETLEHTPVNNPYQLFHNIYYEDTDHQLFDAGYFHDKIVKVIVKKKTDITKFEKFIDKLYTAGVHDLKIVENFQLIESEDFEAGESEDTLSILDRYILEADTSLDKVRIQNMMRSTYQDVCELF